MKKTIAKFMAATMLVASLPAMVLPTFTVDAADADSVSHVGAPFVTVNGEATTDPTITLDNATMLDGATFKISSVTLYDVLGQGGSTVWTDKNTYYELKNYTFQANEYTDNTGAVKTTGGIKTDADGHPVIYFDQVKLDSYKANTILKGQEPKTIVLNVAGNAKLEIPVGKQMSTSKDTKYTGIAYTEDGFVHDADVSIDTAGNATLLAVSTTSKKVTMLKQKITVSDIYVAGISFPVEKFDDQAFKSAKMKTITAGNVKHLGAGCLRNCKKLRKARLGGSKMRKIHSNAFYDCEKLKNIKFNGKNLKAVGSKAFKGLKKNCTIAIKAGSSKYKKVVKMIKKSGTDKVKFKKA